MEYFQKDQNLKRKNIVNPAKGFLLAMVLKNLRFLKFVKLKLNHLILN